LKTASKTFKFSGYLQPLNGTLAYFGLFIPDDVLSEIAAKGRQRVNGKINGYDFDLAIQNVKGGLRYFTISKALRKEAKIALSDLINVEFYLVDGSIVEMPEELIAVLEQDEIGNQIWQKLTAGYQRSLIHYINSTKNIDLRIKRAIYLVNKAKNGDYNKLQKQ
jgi:hypothetical protein